MRRNMVNLVDGYREGCRLARKVVRAVNERRPDGVCTGKILACPWNGGGNLGCFIGAEGQDRNAGQGGEDTKPGA
ncbi:MAG: hypothetical protein QOI74_2998 [Micromonosporaceae bacterium]|nr:hypothetical protein [Micromonosporaceae bacterium]